LRGALGLNVVIYAMAFVWVWMVLGRTTQVEVRAERVKGEV
jgi:hypothetical protein